MATNGSPTLVGWSEAGGSLCQSQSPSAKFSGPVGGSSSWDKCRKKGLFLEISELDLLDQTPVFDIKPYIPYSDAVCEAKAGCIPTPQSVQREVLFAEAATASCMLYEQQTGRQLKLLIEETLGQDPRPASQRQQSREYGILLWNVNVRWQAHGERFLVLSITEMPKD